MSSQLWLDANLVCLQRAVLCANCDVISEGKNGAGDALSEPCRV